MKIWELIDWELSGVVGWMAMAIMVPCLAFYSIGLRSEPNRPSGDRIGLAENIAGEGSPNKEVGEEILERPQDSGRCNYGATGTMPYEISVPVLGINNACVEILPDGDHLYDPEGDWNFGWYGGSTHPTVSGLGAYICHTGFGIDALCDNLGSLREGDEIIVTTGSGQRMEFRVRRVEAGISASNPASFLRKLFTPHTSGVPTVNFLTCSGEFLDGGATERIIVYATI